MTAFLLAAWAFLKKLPGWVWAVAGGIIGLLYLRGRWKGQGKAERIEEERQRAEDQRETREEIEDDVARTDPDKRRDDLGKWVR